MNPSSSRATEGPDQRSGAGMRSRSTYVAIGSFAGVPASRAPARTLVRRIASGWRMTSAPHAPTWVPVFASLSSTASDRRARYPPGSASSRVLASGESTTSTGIAMSISIPLDGLSTGLVQARAIRVWIRPRTRWYAFCARNCAHLRISQSITDRRTPRKSMLRKLVG